MWISSIEKRPNKFSSCIPLSFTSMFYNRHGYLLLHARLVQLLFVSTRKRRIVKITFDHVNSRFAERTERKSKRISVFSLMAHSGIIAFDFVTDSFRSPFAFWYKQEEERWESFFGVKTRQKYFGVLWDSQWLHFRSS